MGSTLKIDLDGGQAILILSSAQALTLTLTEVPFEQWDQRSCKSTWAAGTHQQTFQIAPDPLRITSSAPDSGEAILETPRLVSGCLGEVVLKSAGTGVYGIFE